MRLDWQVIKADLLLLLTAFIWGAAFVAQRVGMDSLTPFYFNAIRFALGSLSLLPLIYFTYKDKEPQSFFKELKPSLKAGFILGVLLFLGSSFQQVGMVYTTAGKAGFITGLYVVIVPLLGIFFKQKIRIEIIIGVLFSVVGLYLLSIKEDFSMDYGDFLVLICSLMFSFHVLAIAYFAPKRDCILLSAIQFAVNSLISLFVALVLESITLQNIYDALIPLLYGGFMSAGVAYTLQVVAQRDAPPAHASILLSLESVFAALTGWFLLGETLSSRSFWGCVLMFSGAIVAQVYPYIFRKSK
ncbi:MAG: Uncharacterized protein XD41_0087 [Desulfonauticus sp. 38_4375]|nr:MAG: Uncharacterized protein XD41_0087 [Desulfonauticus sp. 38_4375]